MQIRVYFLVLYQVFVLCHEQVLPRRRRRHVFFLRDTLRLLGTL